MTSNISTVQTIGKGVRMTESVVPEILASVPESYDWTAKGAVPKAVVSWAVGDGKAPAQKTGPKGAQVTTDFGRGVDTLVTAVKRALKSNDGPKPITLRATLSGEGGGSVTIPTDHALYAVLVEMIQGQAEAAA